MKSEWTWHEDAENIERWRYHEDGCVNLWQDGGRFYVQVIEDVATGTDSEGEWIIEDQRSAEEFLTEDAARMNFADSVDSLYRQLAPTVTAEHLRQLLAGECLYDGFEKMDGDDHRFYGTLKSVKSGGWPDCACNCHYCDDYERFTPEHEACTEIPSCGWEYMLTDRDAHRAVEIHGDDLTATLQYLQQIVDETVDRELAEDRDLIEQGISTVRPARVTDPNERARIEQAEIDAAANRP
ncbi:hypothetical protein [Streptomyces sp. NRRL S-1868]|uniref:hypothetical protein n=1 Tax=Streptomyces sp. NRRL S-1868 TaxID=1463892 RepID=UPI0004C894FD|nr:hypothetical protein [Streptomyces sp. NRRL S-1868]